MELRVGIAGAGRGLRFVRFLRQLGGTRVVGIFDPGPEAQAQAAKYASDVPLVSTYEELLDQPLDAVIVASPQHIHVDQATAALKRGFAVLSEVPAVVDLVQAKELAECVAETGSLYMIAENFCFLPSVLIVKSMIKAGMLAMSTLPKVAICITWNHWLTTQAATQLGVRSGK